MCLWRFKKELQVGLSCLGVTMTVFFFSLGSALTVHMGSLSEASLGTLRFEHGFRMAMIVPANSKHVCSRDVQPSMRQGQWFGQGADPLIHSRMAVQ